MAIQRIKNKQVVVTDTFDLNGNRMSNLGAPSETSDAVTLQYLSSNYLNLNGGIINNDLTINGSLSVSGISNDSSFSDIIYYDASNGSFTYGQVPTGKVPIYSYTGITSTQEIGILPSGQTLGMVYITNNGFESASVNLGTTSSGNEITPYKTIDIDPGEIVSVTVNRRLSNTQSMTMYVNSSNWANVELDIEWAKITYQGATTVLSTDDLPVASDISLGAIKVGDGLSIDGTGVLSVTTESLSDLTDVTLSSPANDEILIYNGSNWVNSGLTLTTTLSSLTDTIISSPSNNEVLMYNGSNWVNSGLTMSGLTDTNISSLIIGELLMYDGSNWVNSGLTMSGLTDTNISSPTESQLLVYDSINSQWKNTNTIDGDLNITGDVTVSGTISSLEVSSGQSTINNGLIVNYSGGGDSIDDFVVNTNDYMAIEVSASGNSITIMEDSLGKIGFFGATPTTQSTGWSVTGTTSLQTFTVGAITLDDLSEVVGTIINELKNKGLIS
jgi:fibronectin-binding autotransporter adhesin